MQVDASVFQRPSQPRDEDIVEQAPFPTIKMPMPVQRNRSVQAKDVTWLNVPIKIHHPDGVTSPSSSDRESENTASCGPRLGSRAEQLSYVQRNRARARRILKLS